MKKYLILLIVLSGLGLGALGLWYFLTPHTPEQYYERLQKHLGQVPPGDKTGFERMIQECEETENFFAEKFPDSDLRDNIAFERCKIADHHIQDATRALPLYENFVKSYEKSEFAPESYYRMGEILLKQKKYLKAVEAFRDLLARFPDHDLADDAQYQIGMIFSEIGEYPVALKELKAVVENYPDSPMAPKAQFKVSDLLSEKMHQRREAVAALQTLQTQYGGSSEASAASAVEKAIGEEVAAEDVENYQEERYGTPPPDHTRSWQDDRDDVIAMEIYQQGLDIQHYDLYAALDPDSGKIEVWVVLTFINGPRKTKEFKLQLGSQLTLEQIAEVDSATLPENLEMPETAQAVTGFKHEENKLAFRLNREIEEGQSLSLFMKYKGRWESGHSWYGDVLSATGGFLRAESKWYPYTVWGDNSTARATYQIPEEYTAVGNGLLTDLKNENGNRTFCWESVKPFFGLTVAYSRYSKVERDITINDRTFQIAFYVSQQNIGKASEVLDEVESILRFYSDRFYSFPYETLKIAETPDFPGGYGACTLILLHPNAYKEDLEHWLLAHEISHQWWGHLIGVTLEEGSLPWQTEGFATYSDILYTENQKSKEELKRHLTKYAQLYYEQASYGTDESLESIRWRSAMYQAVTYQKGALVLHALRYLMGDEAFFNAIKTYASRYAFQSTTARDFQAVCEEFYEPEKESPGYPKSEGERPSLAWFFEEWLERPGFPILKFDEIEIAPNGALYDMEIPVLQLEYVYHLPVELEITGGKETISKRVWLLAPDNYYSVHELPWLPQKMVLDPDAWILKDPRPGYTRWILKEKKS